jgi:poly-gamma-glutamate capsule biosynthesis protein CapA/YwtB (metallophosphatase superfamily)
MRGLFLVLFASLAAGGCRERPTPHRNPEPVYGELHTVAFAGDTVLARRMNAFVEEHGPSRSLEGVREILSGADLATVNLECILAAGGEMTDKGERNPYFFRGRPELVRVLTEAGVDIASLGNNHAGDYGPEGMAEGLEILRTAGIAPVGGGRNLEEAMAPVFRKVGDTVVAFLSMDMTQRTVGATDTRGGPHFVDERNPTAVVQRVRQQVKLARRYADLVFFMTHWGPNGAEEPGDEHRALARRLVREAGIDALLGSSAHQLHGLEVIDGRPIIYDSDNLLFDYNDRSWTHKTAIFNLHFDKQGVRWIEAIPIDMDNGTAKVAEGAERQEIIERLDDLSKRLGTKLWLEDDRVLLEVSGGRPPPAPSETFQPPAPSKVVLPTLKSYTPPHVVVSELPASAKRLDVRFAEGYELLGVEMPEKSRHREGVRITTYWRVTKQPTDSYQIFVHGDPVARGPHWRGDHEPGDWMYPTIRWTPGEIVRDTFQVRPPGECARSEHEIYVGLFKNSGGSRLAVLDPSQQDGQNRVKLGVIRVE